MFSITKLRLFILFITLWQGPAVCAQEDARYRIEALVMRHLDSSALAQSEADLTDYSNNLDFEEQAQTRARNLAFGGDPYFPELNDALLLPPVGPFPGDDPWSEVTQVSERSERMSGVWRNLRLSESFRPEVFVAWEQTAEAPFPVLRVHNDQVIKVEDPFANARVLRPDTDPENQESRPPQFIFWYDLSEATLELTPIPAPSYAYQIDGTVQLRRSRFLHIDLDLAFREPTLAMLDQRPGPPLLNQYQGYLVHNLKQSRQIRTGRMEYFDSPWLGVLVWVTEIQASEEDVAE